MKYLILIMTALVLNGCVVTKDYDKYLDTQLRMTEERNKSLAIRSQTILAVLKDSDEDTRIQGIRSIENLKVEEIKLEKPADGVGGIFDSMKFLLPSLLVM